MNTCPDRDDVLAWLAGSLDASEYVGFMEHVNGCEACADLLGQYAAEWSLDGLESQLEPPPGTITLEIQASLQQQTSLQRNLSYAYSVNTDVIPQIPGLSDLQEISRGGMGVVYHAREENLNRVVAVKVLSSSGTISQSIRARARREAMVLAQLKHPNVVQIHYSGEVNGIPYLVMEWVSGGTLQQRIGRSALLPREAARMGRDLARALAEAHAQGIIHRDLKPDNVLLVPGWNEAEPCTPKLADFGLARPQEESTGLTETNAVLGTPGYMAPEQTGYHPGLGAVSPLTDIHGMGALLYAMLTGRALYEAKSSREALTLAAQSEMVSLSTLCPRAPVDLITMIHKCLEHDPQRRYRSAIDLADDLDRYLENRPILARPASVHERLRKWARRRPTSAVAVSLLALGFAFGLGTMIYHGKQMSQASVLRTQLLDESRESRNLAQRSLRQLTDDSVARLIQRGSALDENDRAFLQRARDQYANWPLDPDPCDAVKFRILGLRQVAWIFTRIDQYEDSVKCYAAILASLDELDARGLTLPEQVNYRLDAITAQRFIQNRLGRIPESVELTQRQIGLLRSLPDAASLKRRNDLATTLVQLAFNLAQLQRKGESFVALAEGLEMFRQLCIEAPEDATICRNQLGCMHNAGGTYAMLGDAQKSEAQIRGLIVGADKALELFPQEREHISGLLLMGLASLADLELARNQPGAAEPLVQRRMEVARAVSPLFPASSELRREVSVSVTQWARVCVALDRPEAAAAELAQAVEWAAADVTAKPAVYSHVRILVQVLFCQDDLLRRLGESRKAVEAVDRQISALTPWMKSDQRSREVIAEVVEAYRYAAAMMASLGDHADAARRLQLAAELAADVDRPALLAELEIQRGLAGDLARAAVVTH